MHSQLWELNFLFARLPFRENTPRSSLTSGIGTPGNNGNKRQESCVPQHQGNSALGAILTWELRVPLLLWLSDSMQCFNIFSGSGRSCLHSVPRIAASGGLVLRASSCWECTLLPSWLSQSDATWPKLCYLQTVGSLTLPLGASHRWSWSNLSWTSHAPVYSPLEPSSLT